MRSDDMPQIMPAALAGTVAALAIALGAGPSAAGTITASGPTSPVTSWVVENFRADGTFDTPAGSATIVDAATGATISCETIDGLGRADSGTYRPQDSFATTYITQYGSCAGPGATGFEVFSTGYRLRATGYDAGADSITGLAIVDIWEMWLTTPECDVSLFPTDPLAQVPLTYDNRTSTVDTGTVTVAVYVTSGTDCAGLPEVGDEMTFETTLVASPGFTVRPA
jgi:hypothetical protein